MANYQFIDAYGSVLTADSSIVSGSGVTGVQRPIINVGSIVGNVDVNHTGKGSVIALSVGSVLSADYLVRNDAVASFLGVDLTKRPFAGDSAGRIVAKPFAPEEARVEGHHSVNGVSVTAILPAAGAGLRNYVTDIQIANSGAADTLVKFTSGGGSSVIGFTIAPTLGGSNIHLSTPYRTKVNETFDMTAETHTSTLHGTALGFKAP